MENQKKLDRLMRSQSFEPPVVTLLEVQDYARTMADIENVVVVVSDIANSNSRIFAGGFAEVIGLKDYHSEDSIWETKILSLMTAEEQNYKFIAELRFFHFLRHLPKAKRKDYYLLSKLRFTLADGKTVNVLHRMHYLFDRACDSVRYAICVYGPIAFDMTGKSYAVNSLSGISEKLASSANNSVLSRRERQVLALIDKGFRSSDISDSLKISIHTVNRHRQEILTKLQVKNSHEACRIAKTMGMI